jgi:hypothetical protein
MIDEMLKQFENQHGFFALTPGDLRDFAEKIAAAEREACARVCEEGTDMPVQVDALKIIKAERHRIANTIRARSKK